MPSEGLHLQQAPRFDEAVDEEADDFDALHDAGEVIGPL
jgi:hypothetical protein